MGSSCRAPPDQPHTLGWTGSTVVPIWLTGYIFDTPARDTPMEEKGVDLGKVLWFNPLPLLLPLYWTQGESQSSSCPTLALGCREHLHGILGSVGESVSSTQFPSSRGLLLAWLLDAFHQSRGSSHALPPYTSPYSEGVGWAIPFLGNLNLPMHQIIMCHLQPSLIEWGIRNTNKVEKDSSRTMWSQRTNRKFWFLSPHLRSTKQSKYPSTWDCGCLIYLLPLTKHHFLPNPPPPGGIRLIWS